MATGTTLKTNLFIPEVASQVISAGLPKAIKFTPIAVIDNSLQGVAGDTKTIPAYSYIGKAENLAEGATITTTQMAHTTKKITIKKIAKGVELTDEAKLSSDRVVEETVKQLTLAVADKIDEDVLAALAQTTLKVDKKAEIISYGGICEAVDRLNEEGDTHKFLFIAPQQATQLRKTADFVDRSKYGGEVMMNGEIGMIAGCRVVITRRITEDAKKFKNYVVCVSAEEEDGTPYLPAITIYKKTDAMVESGRLLHGFGNVIKVSQHYGVGLTNESKVVEVTFKSTEA